MAISGTLMRFSFSQKKQSIDWNIEMAVPVLLGIPSGAVLPPPQGQLGLGGNYYAANHNTSTRRLFSRSKLLYASNGITPVCSLGALNLPTAVR